MLDLLWIKIQEKYTSLPEAYRYFDVNFNNRVEFAEFQKGLNAMRITYQVDQVNEMFQHLDRGNKGYISYLDFCEMAEERRRHLDKFDYSKQLKLYEQQQEKKNWLHTYLDDAHLIDLERMSKTIGSKKDSKIHKITNETQAMVPHKLEIPHWMANDPNFRFGKSSGQSLDNRIDNTINSVYLKEHLKQHIASQITNEVER